MISVQKIACDDLLHCWVLLLLKKLMKILLWRIITHCAPYGIKMRRRWLIFQGKRLHLVLLWCYHITHFTWKEMIHFSNILSNDSAYKLLWNRRYRNTILATKIQIQDKHDGNDIIKDEISQESINKALELGKSFAKNVTNMIQTDENFGCKHWGYIYLIHNQRNL